MYRQLWPLLLLCACTPKAVAPSGDDSQIKLEGFTCTKDTDCVAPGLENPQCFLGACIANECQYTVQPDAPCAATECSEAGVVSLVCGDDGRCQTPEETSSCALFACNEGACAASCTDTCADGAFCLDGVCVSSLPDGTACSDSAACASGNCESGVCCQGSECCNDASDCDSVFNDSATCTTSGNATTCQGTRVTAACEDHVCVSTVVDDDSGCNGEARTCPNHLASIACSGAVAQPEAACPSGGCGDNDDCADGYGCNTGNGKCEILQGLGDACGSCGAGLKCENGVCCDEDSGTCCQNDSQCNEGDVRLACLPNTHKCAETCIVNKSTRCAEPMTDYCCSAEGFGCIVGAQCISKRDDGAVCQTNAACVSGNCVDGVCCNEECTGTCQACIASKTAAANGVCATVNVFGADANTCDATGAGCTGSSCVCTDTGVCKYKVGAVCTGDSYCASNHCEIANAAGSVKKCSDEPCSSCRFNSDGIGSCEGYVDADAEIFCDPGKVCGSGGSCLKLNGEDCDSNGSCASGNCERTSATDPSLKKCNEINCLPCNYDGNSTSDNVCGGNLAEGQACRWADGTLIEGRVCNGAGVCLEGETDGPGTCTGHCLQRPGVCIEQFPTSHCNEGYHPEQSGTCPAGDDLICDDLTPPCVCRPN